MARSFRYRGHLSLPAIAISVLAACGGGGGGGGGAAAGPQLTLSTTSVSLTTTGNGGGTPPNPITFSVSGAGQGPYYYSVSYQGTALASVIVNPGPTSTRLNAGNSSISGTNALAYAIGGTYSGSLGGTAGQITQLLFPSTLSQGAGTYRDTITVSVCLDAQCAQQIGGSPQNVDLTYTITGNNLPNSTFIVSRSISADALSNQSVAPVANVGIASFNLPTYGAYVTTALGSGRTLTSATVDPITPSQTTQVTGNVRATFALPSTLGVGIHEDQLTVNICFDSACKTHAAGSPYTIPVTYVVEPAAGVDYQQVSFPMSVQGMVWDSATQKIYAAIPGYSAQNASTIAQINPAAGTIERTVPLPNAANCVLALSGDGQYLYVATASNFARLRTSDLVTEMTLPLSGSQSIRSMAVAPGFPQTVGILYSNPAPVLTVFDGATPRSQSVGVVGNSLFGTFAWGASANTLYAFQSGVISGELQTGAVSAGGVSLAQTFTSAALSGSGPRGTMQFLNGLLYWDGGTVVNPATSVMLAPFTFYASTGNTPTGYAMAANLRLDRAYFMTSDQPVNATSGFITIEAFQLSTQTRRWITRFPSQNFSGQLISWGSNGLAFVTSTPEALVLVSGPAIAL